MSRALHANFSSYDLVSGGWSEVRSEGYIPRNTLTREREKKNREAVPTRKCRMPQPYFYRNVSKRVCTNKERQKELYSA